MRAFLYSAVVCLVSACSPEPPAAGPTGAAGTTGAAGAAACCDTEQPIAAVLPDTSVYQLESTWLDQQGRGRRLADFRGQPVIMAMIFTTCEYACPRIMADLKAIEARLGDRREAVRFVLVSFDSERDRPPVLAGYAAEQQLDLRRWTLLTGAEGDVRELAAVLGIKFKKSEAIGFSHSNLISLLDPDGRIIHRQKGIGTAPTELLQALREPGR